MECGNYKNINEQKLTYREREVFLLRAQGYSLNQIMETLSISKSTAKSHLEHIHQKLGVSTHIELIQLLRNKE